MGIYPHKFHEVRGKAPPPNFKAKAVYKAGLYMYMYPEFYNTCNTCNTCVCAVGCVRHIWCALYATILTPLT